MRDLQGTKNNYNTVNLNDMYKDHFSITAETTVSVFKAGVSY